MALSSILIIGCFVRILFKRLHKSRKNEIEVIDTGQHNSLLKAMNQEQQEEFELLEYINDKQRSMSNVSIRTRPKELRTFKTNWQKI